MSYERTSTCPTCGAPIYTRFPGHLTAIVDSPDVTEMVSVPQTLFTCDCQQRMWRPKSWDQPQPQ